MTVQTGAAPQVATSSLFLLSIPALPGSGAATITFHELVGLTSAITPAAPAVAGTAPAGTAPAPHTRQLGTATAPTVTLKGGLDMTDALWKWHELAVMGNPAARVGVTISLMNAAGQPVTRWLLANAWCSSIQILGVAAGGGELVQSVQLVCETISQTSA